MSICYKVATLQCSLAGRDLWVNYTCDLDNYLFTEHYSLELLPASLNNPDGERTLFFGKAVKTKSKTGNIVKNIFCSKKDQDGKNAFKSFLFCSGRDQSRLWWSRNNREIGRGREEDGLDWKTDFHSIHHQGNVPHNVYNVV